MSYLFESPFLILAIGAVLVAAFGYVFVNTRQKGVLIGLIAVIALTAACLIVERFVVTPREQVEASLNGLGAALEANDLERVLGYLDPENTETRQRARFGLSRFKITKAKVSGLEVTVNELMSPPAAEAKFTGLIGVIDNKGVYSPQKYPVKFTVQMRQRGDRWVITEHTDSAIGVR